MSQPRPVAETVVTFMVVGCPRCGTTWVDKALRAHPQIYLPTRKQTYFFDKNYDRGVGWFLDNFRGANGGHKAVGEIATEYYLPEALARVAAHFPHIRVIIAVRNPVDRAYSFYQSRRVTRGWKSFQEAAADVPTILEGGRYAEHIRRILDHYPRERVLMLIYDDLVADDRRYLDSILEFLQVDRDYESPEFGRLVQVAAFPKLRRALRASGLGWALDRVSHSPVGDGLRTLLKRAKIRHYAPMDGPTRAFLHDYYAEPNRQLEALTGRDLSQWKA